MLLQVKPAVFLFFVVALSIVALAAVLTLGEGEAPASAVTDKEPVLIIDPGHGGADGGAVSLSGRSESEINLEISQMMKALADFAGVPCVMTRQSEELAYPPEAKSLAKMKAADQRQRVEFINSQKNAVLISVHQNIYRTAQPRGPQTFYGKAEGSQALATLAQEYLNAALLPESRRVTAKISDSLYLFKKVDCPTLLAECGFLSNPEEARLMETREHQLKAAVALVSAYLSYISPEKVF